MHSRGSTEQRFYVREPHQRGSTGAHHIKNCACTPMYYTTDYFFPDQVVYYPFWFNSAENRSLSILYYQIYEISYQKFSLDIPLLDKRPLCWFHDLSSFKCGFLNIFSCQNLLRSLSSLLFLLLWNKYGAKKCLKNHIPNHRLLR